VENRSVPIFDFLILGAGTAGCVLAARLSEDPAVRVCLLEAGPRDTSPLIHVPAAVGALLNHKTLGWGYATVPQKQLGGRVINLPRGKVVGGSGATNGMVYFRGHPRDYDDWAALGNNGWSYRELLPYFIRSEDNENWRDSPYHGTGGPLHVRDLDGSNPLIRNFLEATDSLGYPRCVDYNAGDPEGFNTRQATIRNGRRESTATAYLHPTRRRANLAVQTNALVTRIVVENGRAVGADVEIGGEIRRFDARREVIVCGGSFASPQLLMLSGIGDGAALQALGIPLVQHLPAVGRNLHDHPAAIVLMRTGSPESYGVSWRSLPRCFWNVIEYALFRRGPLAGNVFEGVGYLRTAPGLDRPDIQFVFMPMRPNPSGFPIPFGHGYGVNSVLLRPKSRGTVTLQSPDPHAKPLIDPNLFAEPEDFEPLLRALGIARRILGAPAFERFGAVEVLPGADVEDEDALRDYIRRITVTVHHPVSTCRMGPDPESVVDPELRVRGVAGLRIADASVFPTIVTGNTNATVVAVAEKAADLILGRPAPPPAEVP
jgi:choline dehydrogenase